MRFDYYDDLMFLNGSAWDRYFPARSDERVMYDVIVIGSGMGGGILADIVSNMGLKTLVLEAGPIKHLVNITDLPLQNVVESMDPYEQRGDTDLRGGVSFNLGGRSIFWSAVIPRMRSWELAYWPEDVTQYLTDGGGYAWAEERFRKRVDYPPFQLELEARLNETFGDRYKVSQLPRSYHQPDSRQNPRPGSPDERTTGVFSTAALLASALMNADKAGSDNLHVAVQHLVDRVVLTPATDSPGKALMVEAIDMRAKTRKSFRGRYIVIAAGTTESARLALTSEVKDASNNLGVGLTDHPEAEVHFEIPAGCQFFHPEDQGNMFLRPLSTDGDAFSCELALNWKFWDVRIDDDYWWRKRFPSGTPSASTIKFLFRQPLNERNRLGVSTGGSKYYVDLKSMIPPSEAIQTQVSALSQEILSLFDIKDPDLHPVYNPYSLTYHLAGSMRMNDDPGVGVVDTHLKFHQYDNLYCCDLSVFPDVPASNPSLTLGALAYRLADDLVYKCGGGKSRAAT